jgi:hypothetical protein
METRFEAAHGAAARWPVAIKAPTRVRDDGTNQGLKHHVFQTHEVNQGSFAGPRTRAAGNGTIHRL